MNELFLIVWVLLNISGGGYNSIERFRTEYTIQSQTVTSEEELNKVYQEHKDDGVRVFKFKYNEARYTKGCSAAETKDGWLTCQSLKELPKKEITELEFVSEPCGKFIEKK